MTRGCDAEGFGGSARRLQSAVSLAPGSSHRGVLRPDSTAEEPGRGGLGAS